MESSVLKTSAYLKNISAMRYALYMVCARTMKLAR